VTINGDHALMYEHAPPRHDVVPQLCSCLSVAFGAKESFGVYWLKCPSFGHSIRVNSTVLIFVYYVYSDWLK